MANLDTITQPNNSRKASRARNAAADQAGASVTGTESNDKLMPEGGTEGTDAAQPVAVVEEPIFILAAKNPKRGKIAPAHFEFYYNPAGTDDMSKRQTNLSEAYKRGVRGKDVSWDLDRMHILRGQDALDYLALKSDDDRRAWIIERASKHPKLGDISVDVLKKAGLYVEPAKPEAPAAAAETQTA